MKKIFLLLILIGIGLVIHAKTKKYKIDTVLLQTISSESRMEDIKKATRSKLQDKIMEVAKNNGNVPTVENILSQYRTLSVREVRWYVDENMRVALENGLFKKSTRTVEEEKELLYVIRLNTALHQLLIENELALN